MEKVKVYYFKQMTILTGQMELSKGPATREAIMRIEGAKILEETAQEVDSSGLDANGFLKK